MDCGGVTKSNAFVYAELANTIYRLKKKSAAAAVNFCRQKRFTSALKVTRYSYTSSAVI